jgi:hypothetical protein
MAVGSESCTTARTAGKPREHEAIRPSSCTDRLWSVLRLRVPGEKYHRSERQEHEPSRQLDDFRGELRFRAARKFSQRSTLLS